MPRRLLTLGAVLVSAWALGVTPASASASGPSHLPGPGQSTSDQGMSAAAAGGWLIHTFNGKCLEVENSGTANGARVQQWACNGQAGSGWYGEKHGSYEYVKNYHSGKCLEVENSRTTNGARVQQWACNGQAGSKWYPLDAGNGYYTLRNPASGKCLEVENSGTANGARVQLWDCKGQAGTKLY
ncbi:RICIN domain-containing protein [Streptomyces erythrochromogenes]|uniref:RICIN domain-containing protein n=1 Tax=Streptomyces erythrochromogenes TaxID=285574 RepID=A0ABZ1QMQ7_9ACTN|nr:RICIN domain-containing protein [Streptomyces erythrochromogenes]